MKGIGDTYVTKIGKYHVISYELNKGKKLYYSKAPIKPYFREANGEKVSEWIIQKLGHGWYNVRGNTGEGYSITKPGTFILNGHKYHVLYNSSNSGTIEKKGKVQLEFHKNMHHSYTKVVSLKGAEELFY